MGEIRDTPAFGSQIRFAFRTMRDLLKRETPDPELSEEEAREAVRPLGNVHVLKGGDD